MNSELMERHPSAEGGAQTKAALFNDPALNKGTAFTKQNGIRPIALPRSAPDYP
jgi:hypothetical protein